MAQSEQPAPLSQYDIPRFDTLPPATPLLARAAEIANQLRRDAARRELDDESARPAIDLLRREGFLNLLVPKAFGGLGGTYAEAVRVAAEISRGDASVGALLAFHYYVSAVPKLFDFRTDAEGWQRRSAENNWFWANIHQPGQPDFVARPTGNGGYVLNGSKRWATGFPLADVTTVIARHEGSNELLFAVLPTGRAGLSHRDDWDNLGLRLADTVTVDFKDVAVHPEDVIASTHDEPVVTFPPLYTAFAAPLYGAVIAGATRAALEAARFYVHDRPVARKISGVEKPTRDPLALVTFGDAWGKLTVAESFLFKVAADVDAAYERRRHLTRQERAAVAASAFAARAYASQVGLEVTPRVYDITGTSASANDWGLDRHWRDIRTLTLHDPLDHSIRNVGDTFVNGTNNELPSFAT